MAFPLNQDTLTALRAYDPPGKSDFFSEFIGTYLIDRDQRVRKLRAVHATGDAGALLKTARAIKGSSLSVGADSLSSRLDSLEQAGKSVLAGNPAVVAEAEVIFAEFRATLVALLLAPHANASAPLSRPWETPS